MTEVTLPVAPPLPATAAASPLQSDPDSHHDHGSPSIPVAKAGEEGANAHEVRDPQRAAYWRSRIHEEVRFRFPDVASLEAAGYAPTHPNASPVHYTLGGYADPRPGSTDGGVTDLSRPFSVIVQDGQVIGVMLRAPEGPVEFGAGEWHEHEDGGAPLMHVFFDRPLDQAFGGHMPDMPRPGFEDAIQDALDDAEADDVDEAVLVEGVSIVGSPTPTPPPPGGLFGSILALDPGALRPGTPGTLGGSPALAGIVERNLSGEIRSR